MSLTYAGYENYIGVLLLKPNLRDLVGKVGPNAFDVQLNNSRLEVAQMMMSIRVQATINVSRERSAAAPGVIQDEACYVTDITLKAGTVDTATCTIYDGQDEEGEIICTLSAVVGTEAKANFEDFPAYAADGVYAKVQGSGAYCFVNTTGVNNAVYSLPTKFWIVEGVYYDDDTTPMKELGTSREFQEVNDANPGRPAKFFIGDDGTGTKKIQFTPRPDDDTKSFRVWYFKNPIDLSSSVTTCDLPDEDQILAAKHCAWKLAPAVNPEVIKVLEADFVKSVDQRRKNRTRIAGPNPVIRKWFDNPRR
jgi:hypothetical protein